MSTNLKPWLKQHYPYLLSLTLLVSVAYFNSLGNGFVADDVPAILENPNINKISYIFSNAPILVNKVIYFAISNLFGRNPTAFRAVNILFHLGNTWLIYALLNLLLTSEIAFFAAALFAVHPLQTEAITWISGGPYAQYTFFILLNLLFYILTNRNQKFLPAWVVSTILVFISSAMAAVFPLILLTFVLSFQNIRRAWKKLVFPFLLSAVWLPLAIGKIGYRAATLQTVHYQSLQTFSPLLQIPIAVSSYLQLFFFPKNLTIYHSEMTFSSIEYYLHLIIFLIFLGLTAYGLKKNRHLFFWFAFFLLALSPTLTPFTFSWIVAERYVYLGATGLYTVTAIIISNLLTKVNLYLKHHRTVVFYVVLGLLLLPLTARTMARNQNWKNQDTLWLAAAKTSPSSPQNHNNLGDLYGRRGDLERSAEEFRKAIELQPNYADAYHNLGNTYLQMGKTDEAIESFKKAAELNPRLWQSCQNLAAIYFEQKNFAAAKEWMEKAVRANPADPNLQRNLEIINRVINGS